jgi:hypothetical protein
MNLKHDQTGLQVSLQVSARAKPSASASRCGAVRFAEGCITAYLNKQREGSRYPFQIQPAIIIVQHQRDIEVLYRIKRFFDCGQLSKNKGKIDT